MEHVLQELGSFEAYHGLELRYMILLSLVHSLQPNLDTLLTRCIVAEIAHRAHREKHLLEVWPLTHITLDLELFLPLLDKRNQEVVSLMGLACILYLFDFAVGYHDLAFGLLTL